MVRRGPWHRQEFSTQIVDVGRGQLLDVVPGRCGHRTHGLAGRHEARAGATRCASRTLDLSGPYRKVFTLMTPDAIQVADPFHVVRLANAKLDECRRRVQNETLGHRGRKADPLYRCRRLLTKAEERLDEGGRDKLHGVAARWRSPWRRGHPVAGERSRPRALHPRRCRPRPRVGRAS